MSIDRFIILGLIIAIILLDLRVERAAREQACRMIVEAGLV